MFLQIAGQQKPMDIITIDSDGLSMEALVRVAREGAGLELSGDARERIRPFKGCRHEP